MWPLTPTDRPQNPAWTSAQWARPEPAGAGQLTARAALTAPTRPPAIPPRRRRLGRVCMSAPPLPSSTTPGKDRSLSETQLPPLRNGTVKLPLQRVEGRTCVKGFKRRPLPWEHPPGERAPPPHPVLSSPEGAARSCHLPLSTGPACPLRAPGPSPGGKSKAGCSRHPHTPAVHTSPLQQATRRTHADLSHLGF